MKFLVVGAGIYGCTIARLLKNSGNDVLIIDRRNHIAGNCYDEFMGENYYRHVYGPHIFHTSNEKVWNFITKYGKFNNYVHRVIAEDDEHNKYSMPFNLETFKQILGTDNPSIIKNIIQQECVMANVLNDFNLENKAIKMVGTTIYKKLIKHYTEKQWNKKCAELSPDIIKRLQLRFEYNDHYFNDKYEGIPENGYTELIENILNGVENETPIQYELNKEFNIEMTNDYDKVIFCGAVDELFDYKYGELDWRSLEFENHVYCFGKDETNGVAQTNLVGKETPYTRIIEHVYFYHENLQNCEGKYVIKTFEKPVQWDKSKERFYPVNTLRNIQLFAKYFSLLGKTYPNIILGGRLGKYKYLDMDDAILYAFKDFELINK